MSDRQVPYIIFVTHGFPPYQNSGVFRSEAFARYLPEFGIRPLVVAADSPRKVVPQYVEGLEDCIASIEDGVLRIPWHSQNRRGVDKFIEGLLNRIPVISWIVRARNRSWLIREGTRRVLTEFANVGPRLIYASSPPCEAILLGKALSEKLNVPFVADLRDPWTYAFSSVYRSRLDFRLEKRLEKRTLDSCDGVFVTTNTAKRLLVDKLGLLDESIEVLPNGYDEYHFQQCSTSANCDLSKFNVVYTGVLSPYREITRSKKRLVKNALGLDFCPVQYDSNTRSAHYFLKGLALLFKQQPFLKDYVRVHFVGAFDQELVDEFALFDHRDAIINHGPMIAGDAFKLARMADLLLLLQIDMRIEGQSYCTAIPAKLYGYLRCGVPILAAMERCEATDLVEQLEAGTVVGARDVAGISDVLSQYVSRGGKKRTKVDCHRKGAGDISGFDRRLLTERLSKVMKGLMST